MTHTLTLNKDSNNTYWLICSSDFIIMFFFYREELLKQLKLAKKSKKILGKTLKDFEDEFYVTTGRYVKVNQFI